jgi:hypothetical protein
MNSTMPRPKTRRAGVKERARAARRARRLALEEGQRQANARRQADAEAAENVIRFGRMQIGPQVQQRAEEKTAKEATTEAAESVVSLGRTQNVLQEDKTKAPAKEKNKGSPQTSYLDELEGLVFQTAAKSVDNAEGELDLEVVDGGLDKCVCELVCVCDTAQCMCADGCVCD